MKIERFMDNHDKALLAVVAQIGLSVEEAKHILNTPNVFQEKLARDCYRGSCLL